MVVPGMVSFFLRVVLRETRELVLQTHQNMADGMVGLSMQDSGYVPWTSRGRSTGGGVCDASATIWRRVVSCPPRRPDDRRKGACWRGSSSPRDAWGSRGGAAVRMGEAWD